MTDSEGETAQRIMTENENEKEMPNISLLSLLSFFLSFGKEKIKKKESARQTQNGVKRMGRDSFRRKTPCDKRARKEQNALFLTKGRRAG